MFKIEGTALNSSPRAVDFDTLSFSTEHEAKQYVELVLLGNSEFIFENNKYYLKEGDDLYYEITGKREWSVDSFNPCKAESGVLGEKIHDTISDWHWKFKRFVSPKINCHCCREVNYRFLKYGMMLVTIPFLPAMLTFAGGFILVVASLIVRQVL